ncbi:MAG: hypothetical protein GY828_08165 [Candidatus Gracilibacteria bacterium]|nr:hypothetical protein [Candidatus Gracilibacteria bacterium]
MANITSVTFKKDYARMIGKLVDDGSTYAEYITVDGDVIVEGLNSSRRSTQDIQADKNTKVYSVTYTAKGYVGLLISQNLDYINRKRDELLQMWEDAKNETGLYINPNIG